MTIYYATFVWCFAWLAVVSVEKLDSQTMFFKCSVRKFSSEIVTNPYTGILKGGGRGKYWNLILWVQIGNPMSVLWGWKTPRGVQWHKRMLSGVFTSAGSEGLVSLTDEFSQQDGNDVWLSVTSVVLPVDVNKGKVNEEYPMHMLQMTG